MTNLNINKKTYNLVVFIVWFIPILGTASFSRFYNYELDIGLIKLSLIVSVIIGLFLILSKKTLELNSNTLIAILILYGLAFISDPAQYPIVIFSIFYALIIHFLSTNNYQIVLKQYFWTCNLIALFAFIDFVSFYILGNHLIAWRDPSITSLGMPRLQTIFDEPSHQVFYLLPALMYQIQFFLVNRRKLKLLFIYLFPIVMTITATAAIVLIFISIFFIIKIRGRWMGKALITIIGFLFSYIFLDTFFFKIYNIFIPELWNNTEITSGSSSTYRMLIDVMNSASMKDYLFGMGFYNTELELLKYLDDEILMPYYNRIGFLDPEINPTGFGVIGMAKLLFGYGAIALSVISFFIFNSRMHSSYFSISSFIIFTLFFMLLKLPQTISLPLAIFFIFGLYQAKANIKIRLNM